MDKYKKVAIVKNMLFKDLEEQGVQPNIIALWKEKLENYIFIESSDDFDIGNYYRWINLAEEPLKLNMGGLLSNIHINVDVLLSSMMIDSDSTTISDSEISTSTYSQTTSSSNTNTNTIDGTYNYTFKSFVNKYFTIPSTDTYFFRKLTKDELDIVHLFSVLE